MTGPGRIGTLALTALLVLGAGPPVPVRADDTHPQPQSEGRGITETTATINARPAVDPRRRRQAHVTRRRPHPAQRSGSTRTATAQPSPIKAAPQTIGTSFLGAQFVDDSPFVPPDAMGAVGPTQFLVGVNGRIRTFSKSGTADGVLNTSLDNFFASVRGVADGTSDPRVRYDRHSSRWFVTAMTVPPDSENDIVLAVSDASTITASTAWTFFTIAAPADAAFDFPSLGVDEDALYIGVNLFPTTAPFDLINAEGYVIRKSSVLSSGPIVFTRFPDLIGFTGAGPLSPMGVDNFDTGTDQGYFIGVDAAFLGRLDIRRVSDPGGMPTLSSNLVLDVPATTVPIPVHQPGSNPPIDALDDRLSNGVIRNGRLWTSQTIEVNSSGSGTEGGGRDGIRWYEIKNLTTTPARNQSGTIFDGSSTSPFSYWMGSVMVSGQGHSALGFSRASTNATTGFASAATAGRLATDANTTTRAVALIQGSTFGYDTGITNPERWGDYSYTSLDPNDDMTMWTIVEYTSVTDKWGVRVAKLIGPPPVISSGGTAPPGVASADVTVTGTGFYEPGASFPNHLTASIEGGAVVNDVTSVTPTQLHLDVSTIGVAEGSYDVTITDPDGQSDIGTLTVAVPPPVPHDLAVIKVGWPKTVAFDGMPATKTVSVTIQNRSPHAETIPDLSTLGNLVDVNVDSLGGCPDASVALGPKQKTLPATIKPKGKFTAKFAVTFDCPNNPVKGPGHEDFTVSASVHHDALDGADDTHAEDDLCPHDPLGIDPNPDGSITDKGCGAKKADGTLGGPMLVDLYAK